MAISFALKVWISLLIGFDSVATTSPSAMAAQLSSIFHPSPSRQYT